MYEARLSDPVHGQAIKQAETKEAAVEAAFRELAASWIDNAEWSHWPADHPMFDGWIEDNGEVWWNNRADALIGTVHLVPEAGVTTIGFTQPEAITVWLALANLYDNACTDPERAQLFTLLVRVRDTFNIDPEALGYTFKSVNDALRRTPKS